MARRIKTRKKKEPPYFNVDAANAEFRRDADHNPHVGRKTAVRIISEYAGLARRAR